MPTQIFPGEYASLEKIASFVRHEAESAGLTQVDVFSVETAVDEAVSNIIEHAYRGENKGQITVTCNNEPDRLTITLEDSGLPFDPTTVPIPDVNAALKARKDHGLGIFMMKKWMDDVHFEFCQDCNRLVMTKLKEKKG
jgi:Anti-sigma regulatory factor (Ser/Thr protein kinase)